MRKLFKLLTSRLFITALAILIELALIIVVLLLLNNFVNYAGKIEAKRNINANGKKRGAVEEVIITNYENKKGFKE